ncbi:kinase-like domain-containing protein [Sporodiniella umbellata]|nr:kinase-like domain-containing protein [Sporodiniella umbellata]
MMVSKIAQQKAEEQPGTFLNTISTASSSASSDSSSSSVSASRRRPAQSRPETASLKEYGECYKRLGSGTSAVVMALRKRETEKGGERIYAIKQFRKKKKQETDREYMKRLTAEFCISSTFSHPNVIHTMDLVLDEKKRYCTVMEYCPGGDLYACIMMGRMSEVEKLCCFKQMIQGLAYLHSLGVAHRDIKPENLLLTMDGQLKITDFGVSDVFRYPWESKERTSIGLVGSEPYIAPEQFEKKEYWGQRSDVWSAGVVFYCILLGGLTWHKAVKTDTSYTNYVKSLQTHRTFELFLPLGPEERRMLLAMLDPNPHTRILASQILNDPWFQSIPICHHSVDAFHTTHNHTAGIQPVCKLPAKK